MHFSSKSFRYVVSVTTRHVNLSVLCLTYRSPRVCLVCLCGSLKRWSYASMGYRLTEYLLKLMIDRRIFVKS
jgi:hypothetical protein